MQLSELHIPALEAKFPSLVRISFLEVKELRDSHLEAVASSKLQIQELQIGGHIRGQDGRYVDYTSKISDTVHLYFSDNFTPFVC